MSNSSRAEIWSPAGQVGRQSLVFNRDYRKLVTYDAQAFLSPNGGTGKGIYLRNLIAPYRENFIGLATPGHSYFDYKLIQKGFSRYHLWHQISLPRLLNKLRPDFFLAPYNTAPLLIPRHTDLVLVLHDLILLDQTYAPTLRQKADNEYRRRLIPRAVSRALVVLTVSSFVKGLIERRFPSARVHLIPNTISSSWFVGTAVKPMEHRENYILAVTSNAAHKNADRAIDAYATFVAKEDRSVVPRLRLVGLAGSTGAYRSRADRLQVGDLVDFEPHLTEATLQNCYRRARAVLVPSLMEGFGIPILEAMASGTPVMSSNTTSLPEVGGSAAAYFPPTDVIAMASTLTQVLGNRDMQQRMIYAGICQAKQYHPNIVGNMVRAFWDGLLCR